MSIEQNKGDFIQYGPDYFAHRKKSKEMSEKEKSVREKLSKRMGEVGSAVAAILIRTNSRFNSYVIVSDEKDADHSRRILYYEGKDARELLTAAFHRSRERKGELYEEEFKVVYVMQNNEDDPQAFSNVIVDIVTIRRGGGYAMSNKKPGEEIVHLLLYSPFTKRYEAIIATNNRFSHTSYIDYRIFRDFVYKYGNPELPVQLTNKGNGIGRMDWSKMNDESILKEAGYSVDKGSGKSSHERREILKELVDMDIMEAYEIVEYLDFFISTHPDDKYEEARSKWEEDRKFIQDYQFKKNRERFLIVEKRVPKRTIYD